MARWERSVTNVAAGLKATDAVNLGQLRSGLDALRSNVVQDLRTLSGNIGDARVEARRGTAVAIAMGAAAFPSAPGRTSWSLQGASYKGQRAVGASVSHRLRTRLPIAADLGYRTAATTTTRRARGCRVSSEPAKHH